MKWNPKAPEGRLFRIRQWRVLPAIPQQERDVVSLRDATCAALQRISGCAAHFWLADRSFSHVRCVAMMQRPTMVLPACAHRSPALQTT